MLKAKPTLGESLLRIPVEQATKGMFVAELDRPWVETPFAFQGFRIKSDRDLEALWGFCDYVYISLEKGAAPGSVSDFEPRMNRPRFEALHRRICAVPYQYHHPIVAQVENEIPQALALRNEAQTHIFELFLDARVRDSIHIDRSKQLVQSLVASVMRNPDAVTWSSRLRNRDAYTAEHSLNVCTLALTFGRYLGMTELALIELGVGALLHDIGKLRVPLEVLNKPERLSRSEFEIIKSHPIHGVEILANSRGLSEMVVDVAHSHHERLDGRGYPRQLRADKIGFYARIVAIVDVFDALTSDRVYRSGMPVMDCLYKLYDWGQRDLDGKLVEKFIHSLGAYPVASPVRLSDGSRAEVVGLNRRNPSRSKVQLTHAADGTELTVSAFVDLATRSDLHIVALAGEAASIDDDDVGNIAQSNVAV